MTISVAEMKDFCGRDCVVIKKSTGKLTQTEVYEALQNQSTPIVLIMSMVNLSGDLPPELYEKGDEWVLYDIDTILDVSSRRHLPVKRNNPQKCPICCHELNSEWDYCPFCGQAFEEVQA